MSLSELRRLAHVSGTWLLLPHDFCFGSGIEHCGPTRETLAQTLRRHGVAGSLAQALHVAAATTGICAGIVYTIPARRMVRQPLTTTRALFDPRTYVQAVEHGALCCGGPTLARTQRCTAAVLGLLRLPATFLRSPRPLPESAAAARGLTAYCK